MSRASIMVSNACCVLCLLLWPDTVFAQSGPFESTELLGRPTSNSVTLRAIVTEPVEAFVEYDTSSGVFGSSTTPTLFDGEVLEIVLDGLSPNTRYFYRLRYRAPGTTPFIARDEHTFHTQRDGSSSFTFTVQSDSHQGFTAFYDATLYAITLANQAADQPDFLFDLGDTVSLDSASGGVSLETTATVRTKYINQRVFFDDLAHSSPLFIVPGNHENEEGWNLDDFGLDVAHSLPVMGTNARKRYFLNPIPDAFYSGNLDDAQLEIIGDHLKEDYYAFEWGNALFVAIDPFWYTMTKPFSGTTGGEIDDEQVGDRWDWTLGDDQYRWLKETLESSDAPFKFVFTHNLTGGTADYSRGGVEGAAYCEWGGYNYPEMDPSMSWAFDVQRPSWELPIHQLMAENGVTIFFHGHDHVFAREYLDGVVYVEMPHAAHPGYGLGFGLYTDDPDEGVYVVNNSGHVRVTVAPSAVTYSYVRSFLPEDETFGTCDLSNYVYCKKNGEAYYTETIDAPPPNAPPSAVDDAFVVAEDSPAVALLPLANDSDPDSDTLTIVGVNQPAGGHVAKLVEDASSVVYTPEPGYCDDVNPDTFSYVVSDGHGRTATATVEVTVVCENDPPLAVADDVFTAPEVAVNVHVLDNDVDPDGNLVPSSVTVIAPPEHGVAFELGDGTIDYLPDVGFMGMDSFLYEVCDAGSLCSSAAVNISVFDEPVATLEFLTVTAGEGFTTVQLEHSYQSPVVVCSADYANNSVPVVVRVDNAVHNSFDIWLQNPSEATVLDETVSCMVVEEGTWIIDGVPIEARKYVSTETSTSSSWVAEPQSFGQSYLNPVVLGQVMSENDAAWSVFYAQGTSLTEPPSSGALATGKMVGEDSGRPHVDEVIGYIVIEAGHATIAGTELIAALGPDTVAGVGDSPPYMYTFNSPLSEEPEGAVVSLAGMDGPNGGWAQLHGSTPWSSTGLSLSVDEDQVGDAERNHTTEQVAYVAFCPSAVVNTPPVADDQFVTLDEGTPSSIVLTGADADGDALSYAVVTPPSHGGLSGTAPNLTYTPDPGFSGGGDSFTFEVDDGMATSPAATVTIEVQPLNRPPVAADQTVTLDEDGAVAITLTATDEDGDVLVFAVTSGPTNGTLSGSGQSFTYEPDVDYFGGDSLTFTVEDGRGGLDTGTITIDVLPVNDPPTANGMSVVTDEDLDVVFLLTGADPEGAALSYTVVDPPLHGTLQGTPPDLTYTPASDYFGSDSLTFAVDDGEQSSDIATVLIEVMPVNDAPSATGQSLQSSEDVPLNILLTGTDADGDALTFQVIEGPQNGVLVELPSNFVYTPNADFNGADSFVFTASDGVATSAPSTVDIDIAPVNDLPVAGDLVLTTQENSPVSVSLAETDVDGDLLVYNVGVPTLGSASVTGASITYTPSQDVCGSDGFNYSVSDGVGAVVTGLVSVEIACDNESPIALSDAATTDEDVAVVIDVLANDDDPDGDVLTIGNIDGPLNGTVDVDASGITYLPQPDYCGEDSFSYTVEDGNGASASAEVVITIVCVNDAPVAVDDATSVQNGESVVFDVSVNDSDVDDGLSLTSVTALTAPSLGMLSNNGDGSFEYLADPGVSGLDGFVYRICDTEGACSDATVSIEVIGGPAVFALVTVTAEETSTTVAIGDHFDAPVVVCSLRYTETVPTVVRVSQVTSSAFDVRLQNPSSDPVDPAVVDCLVVEAGAHTVGDMTFEAQTYESTITDSDGSWVGEPQSFLQSYLNPVVLGQVMSENDPRWSVFWCSGSLRNDPPTAAVLNTGITVGEDDETSRASETVGFVVIESGHGIVGDLEFEAALGAETIEGVTDGAPYSYTFGTPFSQTPTTGVVTMAGMNGPNGGFAQLHGADPLSVTSVDLSVDEDQVGDAERSHIGEQVAYAVFAPVLSSAPSASLFAMADLAVVDEDSASDIDVLANDVDLQLSIAGLTQPHYGAAAVAGAVIRYQPVANFCGEDSFSYTVTDGLDQASAVVDVTVGCVNDEPVAADDQASVAEGGTLILDVLANDSDADGDLSRESLSITVSPANGTATVLDDQRVEYIPAPSFTGDDTFMYEICDTAGACAAADVDIAVQGTDEPTLIAYGTVSVGAAPVTVPIAGSFTEPVVVASARYANNTLPVVVRMSQVTPVQFTLRLQNPSGAAVNSEVVSYLVVEKGAWSIDGVKLEAQTYTSTETDTASSWAGETQSYLQSYSQPVVVGQVMTENDPNWSAFWCRGAQYSDPPSAEFLATGKMVGEDPVSTRADETVGFIVFEAGHGTLNGLAFEAALGDDTIRGATDSPPYTYLFTSPFALAPEAAVVAMAGVNGPNGGWAQLHGAAPLLPSDIQLSIDEDQAGDSERNHMGEQVGYLVFAPAS